MRITGIAEVYGLEIPKEQSMHLYKFEIGKKTSNVHAFFAGDDFVLTGVGRWKHESYLLGTTAYFDCDTADLALTATDNRVKAGAVNSWLSTLLNLLWFIKDNSVGATAMYVSFYEKDRTTTPNDRQDIFSDCTGNYSITTFTDQEISKIPLIIDKILPFYLTSHPQNMEVPVDIEVGAFAAPANAIPHTSIKHTISRSLEILFMARSTSFLPLKISFYVMMLETLFNTGDGTIAINVSTRAAVYLDNPSGEETIVKIVRNGYDVRNSYLHGNSLEASTADLIYLGQTSSDLDGILRRILIKSTSENANDFNLPYNERIKWFNSFVSYDWKQKDGKLYREPKIATVQLRKIKRPNN